MRDPSDLVISSLNLAVESVITFASSARNAKSVLGHSFFVTRKSAWRFTSRSSEYSTRIMESAQTVKCKKPDSISSTAPSCNETAFLTELRGSHCATAGSHHWLAKNVAIKK